jgi:thiamine kinase-like enzyme
MLGGRVIDQGTYGCIIQPRLKCRKKRGKTPKKFNDTMLGKITSKGDATRETEIASVLKNIDGSSEYTIISETESCIPLSKSRQDDDSLEKCLFLKDNKLQNLRQVTMPWGGYPLNKINLNPSTFNYFKFCEEILACGAFLVLNDLCHFDIHGKNFLFDNNNKPKLIDFGFTFQPSKLKLENIFERIRELQIDHNTETPEIMLMIGALENTGVNNLINEIQQDKPAVRHLVACCQVNPNEWAKELLDWATNSTYFKERDWLTLWETIWPGFDAWSIGAILLEVLETQLFHVDFVNSVQWKQKEYKIKKILKSLMRASPAERLDAAEALHLISDGLHPLIASGSRGEQWILEKQHRRRPS